MKRLSSKLASAAAWALVAGSAGGAVAASPTPALKTGDYAAPWSLLVVSNPSPYSRSNLAVGLHPTTIHYDASSQTYVLSDGVTAYSFSPNEIVPASSTAAYTVYRDSSTGSVLKLLNDSPSNPKIVLTYVTYGKWVVPPTSTIKLNNNYVVFGSITPPASMPRSGSASYKGFLDGTFQNQNGTYLLGGGASLLANFANGTVGLTVTPVGSRTSDGSKLYFGQLTAAGYIDFTNSAFGANLRQIGGDGTVTRFSSNGYFFGPQASEVGGAFTLTQTLNNTIVGAGAGAFVGKRN